MKTPDTDFFASRFPTRAPPHPRIDFAAFSTKPRPITLADTIIPTAQKIEPKCDPLKGSPRYREGDQARAAVLWCALCDLARRGLADWVARMTAITNRTAAIAEEQRRAEAETAEAARQERLREADKAHRGKINREARDAIQHVMGTLAMNTELAKHIVEAIARGEIPHTKIVY